MAKRKRQRMFTREQRAENRAAVVAQEAALGPVEVRRRADVAEIESYSVGASKNAVMIAEFWLHETDDPGWGINLAACARQYKRLTLVALTREEAENAIHADEGVDDWMFA